MPGQLHAYAVFETVLYVCIESRAVFKNHMRASLLLSNQTRDYAGSLTSAAFDSISSYKTAPSAQTFHLSKQHLSSFSRSRVWIPCSVNVNLSFLTLISSEVWTVNDLIERVGPIERPAALKALLAWVDRGVLREENDGTDMQRFRLLESAPTDAGAVPVGMTTAGSRVALTEEQPAVLTVQQQQAEQMKVYWKVCPLGFWTCVLCYVLSVWFAAVHRGHAHEPGRAPAGQNSDDAQVCAGS